ncbi:MAG: PD-(D/E)XK nuclease family protein [Dehalococcoidia bacterium]|nr:PD-(D/E)XK nuclease family protein [Dehalococcoidia bacterium]
MADSRLYLEAYGPPALERLARLVDEAKKTDVLAPVTVVVPTQYAGLSLRRDLASGQGLVNVRFMVPARLAEFLGSPTLAERGKAPLSPLTEQETIRSLAGQLAGDGPLGPVAQHPRLHSSLLSTFRDLDKLSIDELSSLEAADPLRSQMVGWYRAFQERLGGYYGPEELAWAAAEAVRDGKAASALRDLGLVIFHLTRAPSPGEAGLVSALGGTGRCAMILGLTGDEEPDAVAKDVAASFQSVLGPAQLAGPAPGGFDSHHLVSASDVQEEVRWVVRYVTDRAEGGLPFHRMAVLYRQSNPYASLVPSQLRLAGIPVAGPDPAPLRDTPAGKLLLSIMSVLESDLSRDSVMGWIAESPVGLGPGGGPAADELVRWEIVSRKAGVVKGAGQWQERVSRYRGRLAQQLAAAEAIDEEAPSRLRGLGELVSSAAGLTAFVRRLSERLPPPDGSKWQEFANWAKDLLKAYAHDPEGWPEQHRASYDRILGLVDDLAGLDAVSSSGTGLAGFHQMLSDALGAPSGRTGLTGSGVFVAPAAAAQGMQFDLVFLTGMAEGCFPPHAADDPMLPDSMREAAGKGAGLPLRRDRRIDERRSFLAVLASGGRRILSYPRTSASARRGQHPSPWFLEAAGRLNGSPVSSADIGKLGSQTWLSVIHSSEHSLEFVKRLTPADAHDYDVESVARWSGLGHRLRDHFLATESTPVGRFLAMERGRLGPDFTAWDGRLFQMAGKSQRLSLLADSEVSPTRLERWAVCPFRYFMGDVLNLSALEPPEEALVISSLDRGVVLHDILERFVKTVTARDTLPGYGEPWDSEHLGLLRGIAEEEFDRAEAEGVTGKKLLWHVVKAEFRQDLDAFLEEDSRWRSEEGSRPLWAERSFGMADTGSLPPVVLTLPSGVSIRFRGRIDRVDSAAGGSKTVVIDYKSGGTSYYQDMKDDPLAGGRHLQLPVYALAARSGAAGGPDTDIEACYWFVTARGGFERRTVPLAQVEDRFLEVVEGIASGIRQGLFPANPGPPGWEGRPRNCQFCDFDRICPANREVLWHRKQGNPELAPYLNLAGAPDAEEADE